MTTRLWIACLALALSDVALPADRAQPPDWIVVSDADGLVAALTPANAGRHVHVLRGTYVVHAPLTVPDGVALEGEGVMLGKDLPDGFEPGTETRIVPDALAPFAGDLLTLGNAVTISGLIVQDIAGRPGNVVATTSRRPDDQISASILRCQIINPKASAAGPNGPLGRAVTVLTQNRSFGAAPPPDEGASVSLVLTDSIIQSPNGSALFAINFASRGSVTMDVTGNRVNGQFEVTAGVSRPDEVTGASVTIRSQRNAYSSPAGVGVGWTIDGGSSPPIPGFVAPGTSGDVTRFTSIGDTIEHFPTAIIATAAKRHSLTIGPVSGNVVELQLIDLQLSTVGPHAADLVLQAALVDGAYAPGDDTSLRVLMARGAGSGARQNFYANETGPAGPQQFGTGNALTIVGSPESFSRINTNILPAPGPEFFISALDR